MKEMPIISGLYAIIDTSVTIDSELQSRAAAVLAGGATTLQYRDKSRDQGKRRQQAQLLAELCHDRGATFIVNDDYKLAAIVGAQGVHLGEDDDQLAVARAHLGEAKLIGVSCYNQLTLATRAQQQGADYVAFGRCFPSTTKPGERYVTVAQIRQARRQLTIPIVGIGGITAGNTRTLRLAGVDAVAVIGGLFSVPDSEIAARKLCEQMENL